MEIREKIEKRCHLIIDYLQQLEQVLPESSDEYAKNYINRNAAERLVEKVTDATTDVIALLCRIENVTSTTVLDFSTMATALQKNEVLTKEVAQRLIELYGFKNRIMYNYGDHEMNAAYEILISEFVPFYQEFVEYIDSKILPKI